MNNLKSTHLKKNKNTQRFVTFFLVLFLTLGVLGLSSQVWAKVRVVSTLPVFSALTQALGGDRVEIKTLARPNQDPHFLQPKPSYVVALHQADILIRAGMELEVGWIPIAVVQSRNPKIQTQTPGDVDASRGIQALEVPGSGIDRASGDVHPMGNPHYWLDPRNGPIIAQNILNALIQADPTGKAQYENNYRQFVQSLEKKLINWAPLAAALSGQRVLTYHRTWSYFAHWTGLQVVNTIEPKPGIPPNSQHVDRLVQEITQQQIKMILMDPYYPRKVPEYLAEKTKIALQVAEVQPTTETQEGYFQWFDTLLRNLVDHAQTP